ncbi:hypothetical protein RESH_01472 [Rhodopirellula europaea SH398]|uniref:Uncharacterized protein n=2 Tax=Rhodopirellula europaea TaxID=1263866 RepID=M5S8W2_9BACT|nr:hypothetical protein RE6C_00949 [Rhodopirellula europaea 6C]EMI27911.1 hypothetical protein RESH_01472 [Rhodopirellula europaea SH398]
MILVPSNHLGKQLLSTTHIALNIPLFGSGNATQGHKCSIHAACTGVRTRFLVRSLKFQ